MWQCGGSPDAEGQTVALVMFAMTVYRLKRFMIQCRFSVAMQTDLVAEHGGECFRRNDPVHSDGDKATEARRIEGFYAFVALLRLPSTSSSLCFGQLGYRQVQPRAGAATTIRAASSS